MLELLATVVNKLQAPLLGEVPRILDAVFQPTLEMISKNFSEFPDHRVHFFKLLKAINAHCFAAFFQIPPDMFKLVIHSVVWAFKHHDRNIVRFPLPYRPCAAFCF